MFDDDFDLGDAMMLGTGYALMRHGQDRQVEQLAAALNNRDVIVESEPEEDVPEMVVPAANVLDYTANDAVWEEFIGQAALKKQIQIHISAAQYRRSRLPHTLLASGYPGVGKTTVARLIAKQMGVGIVEVVPPFKIETLVAAAQQLNDKDILFIDEIHKLTDGVGARGAEVLLKILEDGVAFMPDGQVITLPNITIIGATTDPDKLPEPVLDRFKIKPYFSPYEPTDLARISVVFSWKHRSADIIDTPTHIAIANACRGTPRVIEEMIFAARDISQATGKNPDAAEVLAFLEVEPDGLTRTHIHYLTAMRQYFGRERDGEIEYIVGEAAIQQILRETKQGIGRVERFLVERGLIDRTPRGRRLTPVGIARAENFIAVGKGAGAP